MKITYKDMFDNISDAAFEILDENDIFNDEIEEMFSSDKTCKDVTDMIHKQKSVRKRHFTFKGVLLAAALTVLTVLASVITVARNNGAALIDDSNRDLVGKASEMTVHKISADEEIKFETNSTGIWDTTGLIKSYDNVDIIPNSITEFAVSGDSGQSITPEIIFNNNDLVIFVQEDGSGWKLDKGETLVFQAQEYESELHREKGQSIHYFYIRDGVLLEGNVQTGLNQTFELTAEKAGEYYICLLNSSSDAISLKEGKVFIK